MVSIAPPSTKAIPAAAASPTQEENAADNDDGDAPDLSYYDEAAEDLSEPESVSEKTLQDQFVKKGLLPGEPGFEEAIEQLPAAIRNRLEKTFRAKWAFVREPKTD